MSKRSKTFVLAVLVSVAALVPSRVTAGSIRTTLGSFAFLKQEKQVNLEFDYSNMKVGRKPKDCVPEEEFIARLNQKQPGHGDMWKREWTGSAPNYQRKFQELLNKQFAEAAVPLEFGSFKDAEYTLILKTTTVVTGTEGFIPSPPFISADAVFVETGRRTNTVAVAQIEKMPGSGAWAFDMREAYAKAGKDLGILLRRKAK
jgi:hypothetical protein